MTTQPAEIGRLALVSVKSELPSASDCLGRATAVRLVEQHKQLAGQRKPAVWRHSLTEERQRKPVEEQHLSGTKLQERRKFIQSCSVRDSNK